MKIVATSFCNLLNHKCFSSSQPYYATEAIYAPSLLVLQNVEKTCICVWKFNKINFYCIIKDIQKLNWFPFFFFFLNQLSHKGSPPFSFFKL